LAEAKSALCALALLAAACSAPQTAPPDKGYGVRGQDPFRFEVAPPLLHEWGGYGSPRFNQVLEDELERLKICRNGYTLRNEGVREGIFSVVGRCRS
jgi:hypothetical protein